MHALAAIPLVAQTDSGFGSIVFWSVILIIVLVLLFGALAMIRRRLSPDEDFHGEGFTLADLRQMHKDGKLSDEEFERAKEKLVEALQAAQARRDAARAEAAKQAQRQQGGINLR